MGKGRRSDLNPPEGDTAQHRAGQSLWQCVDDWPQIPGYLRETLDADQVPRHAVAALRRSLDAGSVVAFVGSGVSMSYGRLGWSQLIQWMAQLDPPAGWQVGGLMRINALQATLDPNLRPGPKPSLTPHQQHMRKLLADLKVNDPSSRLDIQSGRYPAAFQFLEQCSREPGRAAGGQEAGESRLRRCLRAMLRDDAGQAYVLLEELFHDLAAPGREGLSPRTQASGHPPDGPRELFPHLPSQALAADAPAPGPLPGAAAGGLCRLTDTWGALHRYLCASMVAESPVWRDPAATEKARAAWREAFTLSAPALERAARALGPGSVAARLCADVQQALFGHPLQRAAAGRDDEARLQPLHRFVLTALLRLHPEAISQAFWPPDAPATPAARGPRPRSDTIAPGRDPILTLLRDLGLTRFMTTNYDLDIEQAIFDLGFDSAGPHQRPRQRAIEPGRGLSRNALGMSAHDAVFRHANAAELLRFANARSPDLQVVHLHGRVFPGEPLVITEQDYQAMYLQRSDIAEAANDAIELTLHSNTVLFIGSGMSEDDILRPMRQFVTERKSSADRSGVVLLPADGGRAREIEDAIALYSRYGVLTKHFGIGEHLAADTADARPVPVRWLERWLQICTHLAGLLKQIAGNTNLPLDRGRRDALWGQLLKPPETHDAHARYLPTTINEVPVDALLTSLGLGHAMADLPEIQLVRAVARSLARLLAPAALAPDAVPPSEWADALGLLPWAREAAGPPTDSPDLTAEQTLALVQALTALTNGLGGALRTIAMQLELASLHQGWLNWKRSRTASPSIRPPGAQRGGPPQGDAASSTGSMLIYTRNRLALRGSEGRYASQVPQTDRFMLQAPSNSFSEFSKVLQGLNERHRPLWPARRKDAAAMKAGRRRLFLLLARRGLGKGHFFEMLGERARIREFIASSWSATRRGLAGQAAEAVTFEHYAAACFVNLGVSLEFLSAFDRLSLILVEAAAQVFPPSVAPGLCERIGAASQALAKNRLARLKSLFRLYAENAHRAQGRVLIAFNGFGNFYDRFGAPKNAQLHRLVEAMLGPESGDVPIDVMMICQDSEVPGRFRQQGLKLPIQCHADLDQWSGPPDTALVLLTDPQADESLRRKLSQSLAALSMAQADGPAAPLAWVHILRGAQASATVGKYFPEVALAVAMQATGRQALLACTFDDLRQIQRVVVRALTDAPPDAAPVSQRTLHLLANMVSVLPASAQPTTTMTVADLIGRLPVTEALHDTLKAELAPPGDAAPPPGPSPARAGTSAPVSAAASRPPQAPALASLIDQSFARLHQTMRRSRYLLTIVSAAAAERGWQAAAATPGGAHVFDARAASQWIDVVALEASNHLEADAIDRIIGKVLASYQELHERTHPADPDGAGFRSGPASRGAMDTPRLETLEAQVQSLRHCCLQRMPAEQPRPMAQVLRGPLAWRLQQRLLWHLAVMALEAQADVLATAPLVEADCALLVAEVAGVPADKLRLDDLRRLKICHALVAHALDQLVHRCLVFRMEPVDLGPQDVLKSWAGAEPAGSADADAAPNSGWRFTIHRFLQRTILEHLRSPFIEFPKVDQFGLSLWATQPDELPRPNRSAAHDIADLVAAWIGFPKNTERMRQVSTYHWYLERSRQAAEQACARPDDWQTFEDWSAVTLPARMLRAALGVLRATYSVGVVSRFHDFDDDGVGLSSPDEGYFKQHHLQVRWLLEQAKLLKSGPGALRQLEAKVNEALGDRQAWWGCVQEAVSPFHADEIVWLNNECGLFCLVEGRLDNAAGMFRQALIAAQEVEGRDTQGALWCRIHLNLAIVDIERGRIREADEHLAAIESVPDENPILRILARGFRALVDHLSGNLDRAAGVYAGVIQDLVRLGQLRSVAIFSRHLAELHRLKGQSDAVAALHAIEQSIAAATKGGHEDIRHLALLSRVRLAISGVLPADILAREREEIQGRLDSIEHYGHVMGMPRLVADTAYARALYLLSLGETRHAARLAYRCLALCTANGLRMRQIMGMALLGQIYRKRGLHELAEPLLTQAYSMASDCHFGNLRETAQRDRAGSQ